VIGQPTTDTLAETLERLEGQLGREINYTVLTPREFKSRRPRRDAFLENVWNNKRVSLLDAARGDSRRTQLTGRELKGSFEA
jgi:hypothetical protein